MYRSISNLIRWSGLISLLAGVLYIAGALLHPLGEGLPAVLSPRWVPAHLVYWTAVVLMQLGLVGLYVYQVEETGWLGLSGFLLAFVGTGFVGSILLYVSSVLPLIAREAPSIFEEAATVPVFLLPVFLLGFGLGYILFGVATMRAGNYSRWSGILLVTGVSLFVISEAIPVGESLAHVLVTVGDTLFGLALIWMGYTLWAVNPVPAKAAQV